MTPSFRIPIINVPSEPDGTPNFRTFFGFKNLLITFFLICSYPRLPYFLKPSHKFKWLYNFPSFDKAVVNFPSTMFERNNSGIQPFDFFVSAINTSLSWYPFSCCNICFGRNLYPFAVNCSSLVYSWWGFSWFLHFLIIESNEKLCFFSIFQII